MTIKVNIQKSHVVDAHTAIATAYVSHSHGEALSQQALGVAVMNATGQKLTVIPGTAYVAQAGDVHAVVEMGLTYTREAIPFTEELQGFRAVASNMYMDSDDAMWSLQKNEMGKTLVRAHAQDSLDDITELMQSCSTANGILSDSCFSSVSSNGSGSSEVDSGDAVAFVRNGNLCFGVITALASDDDSLMHVMTSGDENPYEITTAAVISIDPEAKWEGTAAASDNPLSHLMDYDKIVGYWRKVLGYSPEYLSKFEQAVRQHALA